MANPILGTLIEAAEAQRIVQFRYLKYFSSETNPWRLVEPYSMTDGRQDLLVYCYQVDPEPEGYRSFMLHKIGDVVITDMPYKPRRRVTLVNAEIEPVGFSRDLAWTENAKSYRDLITDVMADGVVSPAEQRMCIETAKDLGLHAEERDFVHTALFHRILSVIMDDGRMTKDERTQVRFLHRTLAALGYAPGA